MRYLPGNAQHIGARGEQQDSFGFSDPYDNDFVRHAGIAGVLADGMGGMVNGSQTSRTAVDAFLREYMAKSHSDSIPDALVRSIEAANRAVLTAARRKGVQDDTGTTLAAAVVIDGCLYWISAGDSRVYLFRRGKPQQLTRDHVYLNELRQKVAAGRMSMEAALSHPDREHLTSYLGLGEIPELDRNLEPFRLEPGDRIIICSDGLYRALSESDLLSQIKGEAQDCSEALVSQTLAKGLAGQDNVTVLCIRCRAETWNLRERLAETPRWQIAGLTLILVVALAAGLWWRFGHHRATPATDDNQPKTAEKAQVGEPFSFPFPR